MDARETLARILARSEMEIHSEVAWEEAGEELHEAYLAAADEVIRALQRGGLVLVPRALLHQALEALEIRPRQGPAGWWPDDARARAEAKRALRQALGNEDPAEARACVEDGLAELPDVDPDSSDLFSPREKAFNYEEASRRARRAVREAADRVERMGHGLEAQP